jgi:hypothetical protein
MGVTTAAPGAVPAATSPAVAGAVVVFLLGRFGRGSFGVRFPLVDADIAVAAAAVETADAGAAGASGRLNGTQRRHAPAAMFQQFGQMARAHDGQSRIGAVRSSPS